MNNRIFFTHYRQGDYRYYWARDKYNLLYVIRVHPRGGLFGMVVETIGTGDSTVLNPLYTVNWEDHKVHVDSMKNHLQKVADNEDKARVVDVAIQIAEMETV